MVTVVKGNLLDATEIVIAHQVNCQKKMNSGVAKAIREKYPIVFSVACQTGNIVVDTLSPSNQPEPTAFVENTKLNDKKSLLYNFMFSKYGAVAFIGATIDTSTGTNDLFNKNLYKNPGLKKMGGKR